MPTILLRRYVTLRNSASERIEEANNFDPQ